MEKLTDSRGKVVVLIFDEMAIQPHLDLHPDGYVCGLEDMGPMFDKHENRMESTRTGKVADHLLVFMIRCLLDGKTVPIQYGFSSAQTGRAMLVRAIEHIVEELEKSGIMVVGIICDQGSSNVTAMKDLRDKSNRLRPSNHAGIKTSYIIQLLLLNHSRLAMQAGNTGLSYVLLHRVTKCELQINISVY